MIRGEASFTADSADFTNAFPFGYPSYPRHSRLRSSSGLRARAFHKGSFSELSWS
jgi:hypothetical protein